MRSTHVHLLAQTKTESPKALAGGTFKVKYMYGLVLMLSASVCFIGASEQCLSQVQEKEKTTESSESKETKEKKELDLKEIAQKWFNENVKKAKISDDVAQWYLNIIFYQIYQLDVARVMNELQISLANENNKSEKNQDLLDTLPLLITSLKQEETYLKKNRQALLFRFINNENCVHYLYILFESSKSAGLYDAPIKLDDRDNWYKKQRELFEHIYSLVYDYTDRAKRVFLVGFEDYKVGSQLPEPDALKAKKFAASGL